MASGVTSKTFMWGLLGLLILALGGFGASSFGGSITRVGSVGDKDIDVNSFANALQEDIRAIEAQTGQSLTFEQVELFGVPQRTLARLVGLAALDNEAASMGLSIGDENLSRQIMQIDSFAGSDGSFDRDSYRYMLERAGLNEDRFEAQMRSDTVRGLLQSAVVSGITMPNAYADVLLGYAAERRNFTWAALSADNLTDALAPPTEAELIAFHQENAADFTQPEKKRLTYVWLSPDDLIDDISVEEALIEAAYAQREDEFNVPERRLVERLAFPDPASAEAAKARLTAGDADFETLVTDRGLDLQDVDLGDVALAELGAAGAEVFAAEVNEVVGPVETALGAALFRINGVLPGQFTALEDVRDDLKGELAADTARRQIATQSEAIEDLLAGGATLEELAAESGMSLDQIDWHSDATDSIAGYGEFQAAAAAVTADDYPNLIQLDDGGIAAVRLEETLAAELQPLSDVRDQVIERWTAAALKNALAIRASEMVQQIVSGEDLAALGLEAQVEADILRSDFIPGTGSEFLSTVFGMTAKDVTVIASDDSVVIVRLDAVLAPDLTNEDVAGFRTTLTGQADASMAQDIYATFSDALQASAGLTLDQTAINAVYANFR